MLRSNSNVCMGMVVVPCDLICLAFKQLAVKFVRFWFWFGANNCMLGLVSGGRGTLGQCGGVNNPIHYV